MVSSKTSQKELDTLFNVLKNIQSRKEIKSPPPKATPLEAALSPREAYFSEKALISVDNSLNSIYAGTTVSCPPAVSIAVCGEKIDESTKELFKYYGVDKIYVVKQ